MTQADSDPSILDAWSENPVATAAAVGVGAIVAAGVTFGLIGILAAGDEAPIRVRNGTVELELLHKDRSWKEIGNTGTRWKLSKGERMSDVFKLYLTPTNPADCRNDVGPDAKIVEYYADDHTDANPSWIRLEVKLQSNKWKTEVTSSKRLTLSDDEKILSYGANANFIKIIRLEQTTDHCTFTQKDTKLESLHSE